MNSKILITGVGGLVGSEAADFFLDKGYEVIGIDNNMRSYFFGPSGDVTPRLLEIKHKHKNFRLVKLDIRNWIKIQKLFQKEKNISLIIHAAAQPSHDWAKKEPLTDFSINANGTHNLLEGLRMFSPDSTFIFVSTNKVYGNRPNYLPFEELKTRYDLSVNHNFYNGIDESMSIDNTLHSVFGASKLAADILVQEYGKYFNLKTSVFRAGCITGPSHKGVEMHGFLNYLVRTVLGQKKYIIYGYKGKQVRDNIHAKDLINAFYHVFKSPPNGGEVYNIGGSRFSNCSILEAFDMVEQVSGFRAKIDYDDTVRTGDHQWYITNVEKFKKDYPEWEYQYKIKDIITDIIKGIHNI